MAEDRVSNRQIPMDLLATLTAHGLAESPQRASGLKAGRPRGWLARWLGRSDIPEVRGPDLDDEWAGGWYARSRRFLELGLRAHR